MLENDVILEVLLSLSLVNLALLAMVLKRQIDTESKVDWLGSMIGKSEDDHGD